ncbi:MAG: PAS domain S-box protein [Tyzzerella sp.]|uniref:PAS domain S-box protein n=1 Tax=Candidatus Fimicola merdigallinarum TaxID=2840819 RepID=A0A9D9DY93_9FIRM|nr:PAS domain S-box protein [Candidatus Fimicola merdigallinarum]
MFKGDIKDIIMKFVLVLCGAIFGFTCFYIYILYPEKRVFIFIGFIFLVIFAMFIAEKLRYRFRYEQSLKTITENIRNATIYSSIKYDNKGEEPVIDSLYKSIEDIRKKFKSKNGILQTVLDLINTLAVNIETESLVDVVLSRLIEETNSNWGVFYIYNPITEKLELKKSIGLSKNIYKEFDLDMGEGFLGSATTSQKVKVHTEIPDDTVFENRTFMGKIVPKNVMTVPVIHEGSIRAILSFGSMYEYSDEQIELVKILRNYLGYALNNCIAYERTQRMANELQFQNQLIQNMNDELEKKVSDRTEFLNTIINCIEEYSIISVDKDGYITTWNKGAENTNGYKAFEVIGKHIASLYGFDEEEADRIWRYYETANQEGQYSSKGWQFKKDGTRFFAETTITPVYDNSGELQGFTNITKDITDKEILKQEIVMEKAYTEKLIENSIRALVLTDKNGIILNSNKLSRGVLSSEDAEVNGKGIFEFFVDGDFIEKNIKRISSTGGKGEIVSKLLYSHDGLENVKLFITSASSDIENSGVLIYITDSI